MKRIAILVALLTFVATGAALAATGAERTDDNKTAATDILGSWTPDGMPLYMGP